MFEERNEQWDEAQRQLFDVVIIGGGINGACLYHHLASAGYRVLLADKGDFASGTSQASAMMIWGGLLYLRNLDLASVTKLSLCRDRMIGQMAEQVHPQSFRYVRKAGGRNVRFVHAALYLYWLLSRFQRSAPMHRTDFPEQSFLNADHAEALDYEEGSVRYSDSRFVLQWILSYRNEEQIPLNYCEILNGTLRKDEKEWRLQLRDTLLQKESEVRTRLVVNAAGVWADEVNRKFAIDTLYKHIFSKGVFIGIPRLPEHTVPLILDSGREGDAMSLIPWGPISLWGPTETLVGRPEDGLGVKAEDVDQLLDEINVHLSKRVAATDIVSLRCGIRPLAVKHSFQKKIHSLDLSRRWRIDQNHRRSWITLFGGKLTDCIPLATSTLARIKDLCGPSLGAAKALPVADEERTSFAYFPGLAEKVPTAAWSASHEMCRTLEDYLRRRTNISQWIPRGGLGRNNENLSHLLSLSRVFCSGDEEKARGMLREYQKNVVSQFDAVLKQSGHSAMPFPMKEEEQCQLKIS